ncbi:MAG: N-acetylneuraminate synthase family protein [Thermodesulfobacteriota bacterium]
MQQRFLIGGREVGRGCPAFLIAEVGSNFDRDLDRAFRLIDLAVECGADAVKFQSFLPDRIINRKAFEGLKLGFQAKWGKDVYTVYHEAHLPREWHEKLMRHCERAGTIFFSSPYDFAGVDLLADLGAPALKIGSGDVTWLEMLRHQAAKNLPIMMGVGACTLAEVDQAVRTLTDAGCDRLILLQCVTNYPSGFDSANLKAMVNMGHMFNLPYGYSDHTPGHTVAVGAVALGGSVIEKHFTDDKTRSGPDHPFAMDGAEFKAMAQAVRELERALGDGVKRVAAEEGQTVILQRRSLYAARPLKAGQVLTRDDLVVLRPQHGITPDHLERVVGRTLARDVGELEPVTWEHL